MRELPKYSIRFFCAMRTFDRPFSELPSSILKVRVSPYSTVKFHENGSFLPSSPCGDKADDLVCCGVQHYEEGKLREAYKCLSHVIKDEVEGGKSNDLNKAISYLYIAKLQRLTSSRSELLGIDNLEKAKELFILLRTTAEWATDKYKKYEREFWSEYENIVSAYGSIENYKTSVENHLLSFSEDFLSSVKRLA